MKIVKTKSFQLATYSHGDPQSEKLALILPGRLDTKDYAHMQSHVGFLASRGYFAVSFDPPGTWESPGGIELFTTTSYIRAVDELIEYFGNKPTFLIGHSRGGTISMLAGVINPHVISLVPIMATYGEPSSPEPGAINAGVKISYRDLPPGNSKTAEQKNFALPMNYFLDGEQYNVVNILKNCTKPKLILYGTRDSFTTPERVHDVFKIIKEPKMLHELHSVHDYRYDPKTIDEVNQVVGEFLVKYSL